MNKCPKISVIVPVYNAEKFLHYAVESVLSQTFSDFELLLINDGSKDRSGELCEKLASTDSRIRVIHKENGGANSARKRGVQEAKGEWITFVDTDDTLDKYALKTLLGETSEIKCDIVISDSQCECILGKEDYIKDLIKSVVPVTVWGKLYNRRLFSDFVFDIQSGIVTGEDLLMNIRVACGQGVFLVKCITNIIYHYATSANPDSITKSFRRDEGYESLFYQELVGSFEDESLPVYRNDLIYSRLNSLKLVAFENKRSVDVRSGFIQSLKRDIREAKYSLSLLEYSLIYCRPLYKLFVFSHRIKGGIMRRLSGR